MPRASSQGTHDARWRLCLRRAAVRLTLARLAGRLSDLRYHLLLVVDPDTGRVRESMTESELAQRLFPAKEECQGR